MIEKLQEALKRLESCKSAGSAVQQTLNINLQNCTITSLIHRINKLVSTLSNGSFQPICEDIQRALACDLREHDSDEQREQVVSVLGEILMLLNGINDRYCNMEQARKKVSKTIQDFPHLLTVVSCDLEQLRVFIERELNFIISDNFATARELATDKNRGLRARKETPCQRSWTKVQDAYLKLPEMGHAEKNLFSKPLDIIKEPALSQGDISDSKGTLFLCQSYLNVAVHLNHCRERLSKIEGLSDVKTLKTSMQSICSHLTRLQQIVNTVITTRYSFLENITQFYNSQKISHHDEMVKLMRFVDKLSDKMIVFNTKILSLFNSTSIILAYVLDECKSAKDEHESLSRLELLLNNEIFEPIPDQELNHVYSQLLVE